MAQLSFSLLSFHRSILMWFAALSIILVIGPDAMRAQTPTVLTDPLRDACVIRTDDSDDAPFDAEDHHLPDILEIRLGAYAPYCPVSNLFGGTWSANGGFMRLDIVFDGLINPPGPVGMSDNPVYEPYQFGVNPVFGFIELDVDANVETGGEIDFPELRYLGNIARLGGYPVVNHYSNRVAISRADFDHSILSEPFVDRSGEEFHLSLIGDEISSIYKVYENPNGQPGVFDPGETWHLSGNWLHRAHNYERYSLQCFTAEGRYMPQSVLRFRHSTWSDRTTVSLVFPLRNSDHAKTQYPLPPTQSNNGCPGDQFSIEEGLVDLVYSTINADPGDMMEAEFQLIADWAIESPESMLVPGAWRVNACLGSAYPAQQSGGARFVWTDMYPNVVKCDFTGDGVVNIGDVTMFQAFLATHDGHPDYDNDDNNCNQSIELDDFARNFCLFDSNYDGYVNSNDMARLGDMDWNGQVDCGDIDDLALGLLNPVAYEQTYPGKLPVKHGDMDGNLVLDGRDIQIFVNYLTSP